MLFGLCINEGKKRETELAAAFSYGLLQNGHETVRVLPDDDISGFDMILVIGVKSMVRMAEAEAAGIPYLYFDKGYTRKGDYWRIVVNGHHPTDYLNRFNYADDRRNLFGWKPKKYSRQGRHSILIAGSSEKFHKIKNLPHPTDYAQWITDEIRKHNKEIRIIYRPKPSWKDAEPIKGTYFSREKGIQDSLNVSKCMVTYGSNSCFEALIEGIPTVVLGDGVSRSISSTTLDDVLTPRVATHDEKIRLLNNLAYCQFSEREFQDGSAWKIIEKQIETLV